MKSTNACRRCGRFLRSKKARQRGYGASCYEVVFGKDTENRPHMKEEVPFVECGDRRFQQLLLVRGED